LATRAFHVVGSL